MEIRAYRKAVRVSESELRDELSLEKETIDRVIVQEIETVKPKSIKVLDAVSFILLALVSSIMVINLSMALAGLKTMYVVSDSMVPAFKSNDLLVVSENYESLSTSDIIAYEAEWLQNKQVTHRIISIDGDTIYTRGDNNSSSDPSFSKSKVTGEVVGVVANGGLAFNPYTIWGLAIAGLFTVVVGEIHRYNLKHLRAPIADN